MSRTHPLAPFEQEILEKIVAPKLAHLVQSANGSIDSRTHLLSEFNIEHGTRITMATFSEWCDKLGITFEKRVVVNIPGYKPAAREVQPVSQDSADESVVAQFDDPTPMPEVPATFVAGERMVLPGGMRAPTFLDP